MDIKQAVDASAALTLGKDMVFRDYAQGAFRMRGIGRGQTICLLVPPEIDERIRVQVSLGSGVQVNKNRDERQYLKDVLSWLTINSMRMDGIQFSLLCEQNVGNVWRKIAFAQLRDDRRAQRRDPTTIKTTDNFEKAIEIFRERIDLSIENIVPTSQKYSDKISMAIGSHMDYLNKDEDLIETQKILSIIQEEERLTDELKKQATSNTTNKTVNTVVDLLMFDDEAPTDNNGVAVEQSFNREQVQEQEQVSSCAGCTE